MDLVLDDVECLLTERSWTYAKTMPHIPHYWTARHQWTAEDVGHYFNPVCQFILDNGKMETFRGKWARPYLYVAGWRYWIMHDDPTEAKVINRCNPNHPKLAPHIRAV